MLVKKTGKIILGADLTREEQEALTMEIRKTTAEYTRKNSDEIDAIVLWVLHDQFGFGKDRLRRFFDSFAPALDELCRRYEMSGSDDEIWLCTRKLKDIGVDIEAWNKEVE